MQRRTRGGRQCGRLAPMRSLLILAASAASLFAQLPAPNDAGISMGHLHMMVSDPEPHKKLWVDMLGAQVTHAGSLEMWRIPGMFMIVGKARTAPTEGTDGSTVNHIGVAVPSYPEIKAKMQAAKFEFVMDNAANKQIIVKFPDKINVEFTEDATLKVPTAMHHIHIATPNDEKLRDWYVKTFGAKPGMRRNFQAAFIPGGEVDFRKAEKPEAPTKGRSLDHIGFEVKNLEAFCKKLEADGVKLAVPYRQVPALGISIAFLNDPWGTYIELTEGLSKVP